MKNTQPEYSRTVYTTEAGRICPHCGKAVNHCVCKNEKVQPSGDGIVRVRVESKGRKGKTVTTISGLMMAEADLDKIAGELKRKCGAGGAVKNGVLEIQGDHAEKLINVLKAMGVKAKRAGG
jgi:translation initiation factor 1